MTQRLGQIIRNLKQRCNETSSICDKLRIATYDVELEDSGGITVAFRGHLIHKNNQRFGLSVCILPVGAGYIPEDIVYENMIYELQKLTEIST